MRNWPRFEIPFTGYMLLTADDSDNSGRRTWSVSGVVTEFRGENYLLLTRAVFRAAPRHGCSVQARTPDLGDGKF